MNEILQMILVVLSIVVIIFIVLRFTASNSTVLSECNSGKKSTKISPKKLHGNSNSNNYAYSIWFYVADWSYRLGDTKTLFSRGTSSTKSSQVNPLVVFDSYQNNITISVTTYNDPLPGGGGAVMPSTSNNECKIQNFPIQKWVNLIVSLNSRTMDIYLDGKLVRTCILPGTAKISPSSSVYVTPDGGFDGWTSNFQYFSNPLNPHEAYAIYKEGAKCGGMGSFFDKYKLQITYLVNNVAQNSITI
jgi:hypothetical protein